MKPEREGFWFYKAFPVEVLGQNKDEFLFASIGTHRVDKVRLTEDSDWGPEILKPCKHEIKMCIHPTLKEPKVCTGKLCTKKETGE